MEIKGHLSFKFDEKLGEIDIDMELDQDKAKALHLLISDEAAYSELDIFSKNDLNRITAKGIVRKVVLREIINELAR